MKARTSNQILALRRCVLTLFAAFVLIPAAAQAQSSTATARTPGAPAGSYALGDADTVNLFTGNLNYNLSLARVGGRGEAQAALGVVLESQWDVHEVDLENGLLRHEYSVKRPSPLALVGSMMLDISSVPTNNTCGSGGQWVTNRVSMIYIEPDGTEHSLRDRVVHGRPFNTCGIGTQSVGNVFESTSGNFITYVNDTNIYSSCHGVPGCTNRVDGYLFFRNGMKSRVIGGRILWTQDRNGNLIQYTYEPGEFPGRLVSIKDSLGRDVNIDYVTEPQPVGRCAKITMKGFGGQDRVIRVSLESDLGNGLLRTTRPGDPTTPVEVVYDDPHDNVLISVNGVPTDYVKAVWLPDGRSYQYRYNVLGQLARVVLPTGGAVEYDYADVAQLPFEGPPNTGGLPTITNRVTEKRVYGGDDTLLNKTVFSIPTSHTPGVIPPSRSGAVRDAELFGPDGARLSKTRHYFYGVPNGEYSLIVPWWHGKEFRTEGFDADGATLLRVTEHDWRQRIPSWCSSTWPCSSNPTELSPTNNPFIVETKSTLADGNLVSKVSAVNPANGSWAFDAYNNQTDFWEYDYGVGQPGGLVKHTRVSYINNVTSLGNIYLFSLTDTTSVFAVDASGQETLASSTQTLYDEYGQYPLLTYDTATGWQNPNSVRGNPTTVRQWLNTTNTWIETHAQFDQLGNVRKSWDALGRVSETSYADAFTDGVARNTYAFATRVTPPAPDPSNDHGSNVSFTSSSVYDYHSGLAKTSTDINGHTTTFEYNDTLDRLTKVINPAGGGWTSFEYGDTVGDLHLKTTTALDATRSLTSYTYFDGLGRAVRSFSPKAGGRWVVGDTQYDAAGRVRRASKPYETSQAPSPGGQVNPSGNWLTTEYDALGRVVKVTHPDGSRAQTAYHANTITFTDAALKKRKTVSDALGRLIQVVEDEGGSNLTTDYKYDVLGNLRKVEQGPQRRYFMYDSLSRLIRSRNPEQDTNPDLALDDSVAGNSLWSLKIDYYPNGDISARTDARGVKVEYLYDDLNRLYRRTYTTTRALTAGTFTPSPTVDYYYDGRGLPSAPPNSLGKLTRVSSSVSETRYTGFDAMGRVTSSEQTVAGQTYQMPSYVYNLDGSLHSQIYPSGRTVRNDYDDAGKLSAVSGLAATPNQSWKTYASDFDYSHTDGGAVSRLKLGNGRWESMVYNKRLQPTRVGLGTALNATDLMKIEYDYGTTNNNGNIQSQTITVPAAGGSSGFTAVQTYGYDGLNRLAAAAERIGTQTRWQQSFSYDRFGNREVVTAQGATTPAAVGDNPAVGPATNRIVPRAGELYDYDAAGNLTRDRLGNTYSFDGDNLQAVYTQVSEGQPSAQYFYDGEGRRVKKVAGGEMTIYVYNAFGQMVAEYATQAQPSPAPTTYVTSDPLGTPRVTTGGAGEVVARHDYLPFGEDLKDYGLRADHAEYRADSVRQKFTGYERDEENGLDYARARYYASRAGRFTSVDPLMASSSTASPQTFNRYTYALNNPYRYVDPSGMEPRDGSEADDYEMVFGHDAEADHERWIAQIDAARAAAQRQQRQQQQGQRTSRSNSQQGQAPRQNADATNSNENPNDACTDYELAQLFTDGTAIVRGASSHRNLHMANRDTHYRLADGTVHTLHIYGDTTATQRTGIYIPEAFSDIRYEGNGTVSATNPQTGEVIGVAHVNIRSAQELARNIRRRNDAGSRYIGDVGGPGASTEGDYHAHLTIYRNAESRSFAKAWKDAGKNEGDPYRDFNSRISEHLRDFRSLIPKRR